MQKQLIWRNLSETLSSGFFIWDVFEIAATDADNLSSDFKEKHYIECRDGSFIYIACSHFFQKSEAIDHLKWHDSRFYQVFIIGEDC